MYRNNMCGVKAPTVTKSQEWNKSSQPEKDIPSGCTWFQCFACRISTFWWSRFGLTLQDVRIYDRIVSVNGKAGSSHFTCCRSELWQRKLSKCCTVWLNWRELHDMELVSLDLLFLSLPCNNLKRYLTFWSADIERTKRVWALLAAYFHILFWTNSACWPSLFRIQVVPEVFSMAASRNKYCNRYINAFASQKRFGGQAGTAMDLLAAMKARHWDADCLSTHQYIFWSVCCHRCHIRLMGNLSSSYV